MTETSDTIDSNSTENKYTFCFASSDQLLHLTQYQIDLIPYLSILLSHKYDFASIQNEDGEYILNHPLEYSWFVVILCSINSNNPYKLFDELPSDENILDVLKLFDYLGIQSFPLPILRYTNLVRSKPVNNEGKNQLVKYHKASLPEVRRTAAEFVLALAKNEYRLNNSKTMNSVYNLINVILFNAEIFSFRFRHHTLTIAKKYCYPFFSRNQQRQLENSYQLPQYKEINSKKFRNSFSWRGVYVSIQECVKEMKQTLSYNLNILRPWSMRNRYIWPDYNVLPDENPLNGIALFPIEIFNLEPDLIEEEIQLTNDGRQLSIGELKRDRRKEEAQSARSGRFNTLYSQVKIDKFKHRCGPKVKKYR